MGEIYLGILASYCGQGPKQKSGDATHEWSMRASRRRSATSARAFLPLVVIAETLDRYSSVVVAINAPFCDAIAPKLEHLAPGIKQHLLIVRRRHRNSFTIARRIGIVSIVA